MIQGDFRAVHASLRSSAFHYCKVYTKHENWFQVLLENQMTEFINILLFDHTVDVALKNWRHNLLLN